MQLFCQDFFETEGLSLSFSWKLDFSGLSVGQGGFSEPVSVDATVSHLAGIVLIDYTVSYTLHLHCDRCLAPFDRAESQSFSHELVTTGSESGEGETALVIPNMRLDIEDMVQTDLFLTFPMKFLCREDCKGLCPQCGKDLNQGECDCKQSERDPRWSALDNLIFPS